MAREAIFSRLPEVWHILDQVENVVEQQGVLERYLSVWDAALDLSHSDAVSVLDTRDINTIPDRYLRLIGDIVGHRWKDYRSYQWNRQRIRESIAKYSYKGTSVAIADLVREHGGSYHRILDMASTVDTWNIQVGMFLDSDYFHPGVYKLYLSDDIDLEHFLEDFEYLKPAGTKWILTISPEDTFIYTELNAGGEPQIIPQHLINPDFNDWWNFKPQPAVFMNFKIEEPLAIAMAFLFIGSLTYTYDEELLTWGDDILPAEYNHRQPLVEPEIPT